MLSTPAVDSVVEKQLTTFVAIPFNSIQHNDKQVIKSLMIKTLPNGSMFLDNIQLQEPEAQVISNENSVQNQVAITISDRDQGLVQNETLLQAQGNCLEGSKIEQRDAIAKFECVRCGTNFATVASYRKHMLSHRSLKKFNCSVCSAGYNNENNLTLHLATHDNTPSKCPLCNVRFQRMASFKSHLMIHHIEELFSCEDCRAEFEKEEELIKHMETHASKKSKDEKTLVCGYCKIDFENLNEYKEHISYHVKMKKLVLKGKRSRRTQKNKIYLHMCSRCSKSFPKASLLERHERIHSGERPFVCQYCNRGFTQKGTLKIHLSKHAGFKPFQCILCPAKFNQKGNLRVHVEKTHTAPSADEKVYHCTLCTCIFKKIASLNGHMTKVHAKSQEANIKSVLVHLKDLEKQTSSLLEENKYTKKDLLEQHKEVVNLFKKEDSTNSTFVRLAESGSDGNVRRYLVRLQKIGDTRWYFCNFCSRQFKKPSDLIRHIRVHTREKPFRCKQCGAAFSLKSTLVSHALIHVDKREYTCTICSATFLSGRSLNAHMRKHLKDSLQNYQCVLCNTFFSTSEEANLHKQQHSNETNFIEPVLKQPLLNTNYGMLEVEPPKSNLSRIIGKTNEVKSLHCTKCDTKFTKLINLNRHMQYHNGERKFKCDTCDKAFMTSYRLKEHIKFHKNIRNYACKICNKRFVTAFLLKRHLIVHSTHKPYVCPYCHKTFKTVLLCRIHIRRVHKKEVIPKILPQIEKTQSIDLSNVSNNGAIVFEVNNIDQIADSGDPAENNVQTTEQNLPEQFCQVTSTETIQIVSEIPVEQAAIDASNQVQFETIFVNTEDLQISENSNIDNTVFTQIQNSEPLLLNTASDLQENILFNIDGNFIDASNELYDTNFSISATDATQESNFSHIVEVPNKTLKPNSDGKQYNGNVKDKVYFCNESLNLGNALNENISLYSSVALGNIQFQSAEEAACTDLPLNISLTEVSNTTEVSETINSPDISSVGNAYEDPRVICITCKIVFSNIDEFKDHNCDLELKAQENTPKGKHCESATEDYFHSKQVNKTDKKVVKFDCVVCGEIHHTRKEYLKHLTTHSNSKSIRVCEYCGKEFKKPSDLKRHLRTHTGEKPFACKNCDKKFSLRSTLETHYRTHDPVSAKEFNCIVCNSFFSTKSSLKVHMLIHTGKLPFQCSFCPFKFRTAAHRKSHLISRHKCQSQKDYQNDFTKSIPNRSQTDGTRNAKRQNNNTVHHQAKKEENFTAMLTIPSSNPSGQLNESIQIDLVDFLQQSQKSGIVVQDITENGDLTASFIQLDDAFINSKPEESNLDYISTVTNSAEVICQKDKLKNFECDVCHKKYNSKDVLRRHRKIHGQNKKFPCSKCDKGFDSQEGLDKHGKFHYGYRPYSCAFCANSFTEEQNLKTHLKRIHNLTSIPREAGPSMIMKFDLNEAP